MKFIITKNKFNNSIKRLIKSTGWEDAYAILNGSDNLIKSSLNNDPSEFLNLFNDLTIIQSQKYDAVYFKNESSGDYLMKYYNSSNSLYVDNLNIWKFFQIFFDMDEEDIQTLIREWFEKVYEMRAKTVTDVNVFWMG